MRYLLFGKDMFKDKGIHCREHRPGRWQVYFSHEGKQVHLQRDQNGHILKSETAATNLMMYIDRTGYDPRLFGKDKSFQFDLSARTWVELTKKDTDRMKERERFVRLLFIPHFGKQDIRTIKTVHIDQFITFLQDKGFQGSYIGNILGDLRSFFKFNKKSIPDPPEFRRIETQEKVIRWLDAQEQDQVFQFIPKKHLPIFTFLRWYGCRLNEACGLLWENINLRHGYLSISTVVDRKGELKPFTKARQLKIRPIIPEIEWIFDEQNGSEFVFSRQGQPYRSDTVYQLWKNASQKAHEKFGTPIVNVYCAMRHSFATQRLNQGFDLAEVSAALGHASVEMTKKYAAYSVERLSNVMRGVHKQEGSFINREFPKLLESKDNPHEQQLNSNCDG
jgi:integrase/recombinase XerD